MTIRACFTIMFAIVSYIALMLSFSVNAAEKTDEIKQLSITEFVGTKEKPVIQVNLEIKRPRDLYVAVKDFATWKNVKQIKKTIKKSGKYHFKIDTKKLNPARYRIVAYLTPRGKNWNERVGNEPNTSFTIVNEAKYVQKVQFSEEDIIKQVQWPKEVGNAETILLVKYDISEPRDIHLKLFDHASGQAVASLKYSLKEPGEISFPIVNLAKDVPPGKKYVWVSFLTEQGKTDPISNEYKMPFMLLAE